MRHLYPFMPIQMSRKLLATTHHLLHPSGSKAATPTLATKCNRKGEKIQITFFPDRGSNSVRQIQSPALYHVAIKAGFYRKAVEVYLIPKLLYPSFLHLYAFMPIQMSRKLRVTTQHLLCPSGSKAATPTLATKCNRKEKKSKSHFSTTGDRTRSAGFKVLHSTMSL